MRTNCSVVCLAGSPFRPKGNQNTVSIGLIYAFRIADAK